MPRLIKPEVDGYNDLMFPFGYCWDEPIEELFETHSLRLVLWCTKYRRDWLRGHLRVQLRATTGEDPEFVRKLMEHFDFLLQRYSDESQWDSDYFVFDG